MFHQLTAGSCSKVYRFDQISNVLETTKNRQDTFSNAEFMQLIEKNIESKPQPVLISVDVFDTLLLRDSTSEIKRFLLIAEEQAAYINKKFNRGLTAADLLAARLSGTKISYCASKIVDHCREGSIVDIYRVAARSLCLPSESISDMIRLELDHEVRVLEPNVGLLNMLRKFSARGATCIMISDMYLHAHHIECIVERLIPDWNEIFVKIYSSADTTVSKATGKVFPLIVENMGVSTEQWVHMGDALRGDYGSALNHGISAIYLPIPSEITARREICEGATLEKLTKIGLNPKQFNS